LNAALRLCVSNAVTRNPVTVTVAYSVVPGHEADFHAWGWAVLGDGARQPGFLGGGVLVDQEAEWHVVYRFASDGSARTWEESGTRAEWESRTSGVARETGRRSVQGSAEWFDAQAGGSVGGSVGRSVGGSTGGSAGTATASATAAAAPAAAPAASPPAKWKLWFINMSAVFPPVLLFNLLILPYLGGLNPLFRTLLLCLCVTALVTWILMPRLQRFFKKCLYPPLQALRGRHKKRTA
jgi:antibiotic biosynthesis monooxygenase (ABM) superfamily enzyme